jgi:hypothetical protein
MYSAGEIVSLLYGPLADVASVALDPLPEVCDRTALCLLCVGRRSFVRSLVKEGREAATGLPSREPQHTTLPSPAAARGTAVAPASMWPGARG